MKRFLALLIAITLCLSACGGPKETEPVNDKPGETQTGAEQGQTQNEPQTEPAEEPEDPQTEPEPEPSAAAEIKALAAHSEDELRMKRWAEGAALKAVGEAGIGDCEIAVTGIASLDLGMAGASTVGPAKAIELYRVSYAVNYDSLRYGGFEWLDELGGGWYAPNAEAEAPLFAVYAYDYEDLEYEACAGYYTEGDVAGGEDDYDELMPYRRLASSAMDAVEAHIADLSQWDMGPETWKDHEFFHDEFRLSFEGSSRWYGPGGSDANDFLPVESRTESVIGGGYGEDDRWYSYSYETPDGRLEGVSYFTVLSGEMETNSIETTIPGARTPRGVGVGSTRKELEAAYPEAVHGTAPWREDLGEDCYYYNLTLEGGSGEYYDENYGPNLVFQMDGDTVARVCVFNIFD
ncbi:MAG: hypothetical protein II689_02595 [Firmicutes bacterium]|nr:hypothetical protein [Bacillota bacterium]